jgi:hypothetical protein
MFNPRFCCAQRQSKIGKRKRFQIAAKDTSKELGFFKRNFTPL